MGLLDDYIKAKSAVNPVSLAWGLLPPEAKASYRTLPGFIGEMSPGASVRDAVEASGEIGHGLLNADPKRAALGAAGMGAAILGFLPFGRSGKVAQRAMQETAKEVVAPVAQTAKEFTPVRAYHGTPHSFDAFDSTKIGTGEGAQSFGHGLYFAENEAVANQYKKKLAGKDAGHMYEVQVNADPAKFVDWDKPLAQQSPEVQAALGFRQTNTGIGGGPKLWSDNLKSYARDTDRPINYAMDLRDPETAKALKEAGIPGIKYLDQGSRGAGDGSRNYVVFDAATIEILRKYGLLPVAGAGAAVAAPGLLSPTADEVR